MAEQWWTVTQVAEATHVHPETVRRWVREGRLRVIRLSDTGPKGRIRVDPREVDLFMIARQRTVAGPRT